MAVSKGDNRMFEYRLADIGIKQVLKLKYLINVENNLMVYCSERFLPEAKWSKRK